MTVPAWRVPMVGRSTDEHHRVATPLELLFDLTFVVAVAAVAAQFAHAVEEDHTGSGLVHFAMVFFAIWWAWMNFTWFASAYDTDDVAYRVLTMVQMAGVLVLAGGVPAAFGDDFTAITVGYVIMRVAMIVQWARAAAGDPVHRAVCTRYAAGILVVQVFWLLRLLLPDPLGLVAFVVLALAEMTVPMWAERGGPMTTWHPHHIAERYGLFTIILLGECVVASVVALQGGEGWDTDRVVVFVAGLLLLFSLWWLYFLKPAGEGLERRRDLSFVWGYGHYLLFGSLGALAAGVEVTAASLEGSELPESLVAYAVAVPVGVFVVMLWALHAPLVGADRADAVRIIGTALAVLVLALTAALGVDLPWVILLIALAPVVLVATSLSRPRPAPRPGR